MEIELCGYKILIDEEDYEKVTSVSWGINKCHLKYGRVYFYHGGKSTIFLHRHIMGMKYKDGYCVDHINGNTLDNRKCNLRKCTRQQNLYNKKKQTNCKSGYKGVIKVSKGRWRSVIGINKKIIYLGSFKSPEEAHAAYCEASKKYHGEFGRIE